MRTVLFACIHNAGRSQMAEALFNSAAGPDQRAVSAGTMPGDAVQLEVVEVMSELGIDVGRATPRLLTDDLAASVDLLITMGCGEACPAVPGLQTRDWAVEDTKGRGLDDVRRIRDDIAGRIGALLREPGG